MRYVMIAGAIMVMLAIFPIIFSNNISYLVGVVLGLTVSAVILLIAKPGYIKRNWDRFPERQGVKNQISFEKDRIVLKGEASGKKIEFKYADIKKKVETEKNYYLITRLRRIIIIDKDKCSAELLDFLRNSLL